MCFVVAYGNTSVFCCRNGSYVVSAAGPLWSQRSAVCPPLAESEAAGPWLVCVAVFVAWVLLVVVGCVLFRRR